MITLDLLQYIWSQITPPAEPWKPIEAQQIDLVQLPEGHPFLYMDVEQHRHLLLPIAASPVITEDRSSAGVHITAAQWKLDHKLQPCVDVICLKPHLNELFDMIILDILRALQEDASRPGQAAHKVLEQWREMLSRERGEGLSLSQIIGLFGELQILLQLTAFNDASISSWAGPMGARWDFLSGPTALEVKSSTQRKGFAVTINGHDQLEPPERGQLYLAALKLERLVSGGLSLSDLVGQLIDTGCSAAVLWERLRRLDVTTKSIDQYNTFRFQTLECWLFSVDDTFPRIVSQSFKENALPEGILSLSYEIDLLAARSGPFNEVEMQSFWEKFANSVL